MQILATILTTAFIVLKLTDRISWGWVWVLSPYWILAVLWGLTVVLAIICTNSGASTVHKRRGEF